MFVINNMKASEGLLPMQDSKNIKSNKKIFWKNNQRENSEGDYA